MNERQGYRPSQPEMAKPHGESPETNTIDYVLTSVESRIQFRIQEVSPELESYGHLLGEAFANEFRGLLNPGVETMHLTSSQAAFVVEALMQVWSIEGALSLSKNPISPVMDLPKLLGVATYLNSLALGVALRKQNQ